MVVARSVDLEWRAVEDELVLLDLRTQRYLSLNRTGAELWPLIVEGAERGALVQSLVDKHSVDKAVAERDVDALVTQLREADLLGPEEGSAANEPH